ncbi:MAG: isochorismatase family protein [Acidimicrobiia bacterium]|nr:isochorismatase family protein [Acidimicrobiia bacterium]
MEYNAQTALVIVDVQNDFADPQGSLYVAGGEDTIVFINDQINAAQAEGATIAYTQDWHPDTTPHFAKDGGIWPVHCVGGTWGSELHPDLVIVSDAIRIRKGTAGEDGYSGFTVRDPESGVETATALDDALRAAGVERAAVLGLATDYCVKSTAIDASHLGFDTTLLADGVRAVNLTPGDGARAVAEMAEAGIKVR